MTPTTLLKWQHLLRRRAAHNPADRRHLRIVMPPGAAGSTPVDPGWRPGSTRSVGGEDLDLATWEDAEWR
jgi:hypothetical protein